MSILQPCPARGGTCHRCFGSVRRSGHWERQLSGWDWCSRPQQKNCGQFKICNCISLQLCSAAIRSISDCLFHSIFAIKLLNSIILGGSNDGMAEPSNKKPPTECYPVCCSQPTFCEQVILFEFRFRKRGV